MDDVAGLEACKAFYAEHLYVRFGAPLGCTPEEVSRLEHTIGHRLPAAYVAYLRWMGNDVSGVFRGSDCYARHVLENSRWVKELLAENEMVWEFSADYLCFFCHQGYLCAWFELGDGPDDPPCYFFGEGRYLPDGSRERPQAVGTFSNFLLEELRHAASLSQVRETAA